ncbi:MAG: sodium-dependent bicarbonate transport family permease [Candidatus Cyclobacteriaceae bacterium M3_2C_046]
MNGSIILDNLLSPPILFFFLGLLARWIKSDLEIPPTISKFLSLYLLFSIGLKGGAELQHSGFTPEVFSALGLALFLSVLVPVYSFYILKKRFDIYNAGAIAATYGSISAVTFVTAISFLQASQVKFGGFMVASMALMESPAIVLGVLLIRLYSQGNGQESISVVIREAFTNGSVVLILGALIIGVAVPDQQMAAIEPFSQDLFKGILTFFLLDMGLLAGKRLQGLRQSGWFAFLFALLSPLINASIALLLAYWIGLSPGNTLLIMVLAASASYIAVPAALRMAVPEANPGIYIPMSLALTFPFNIIIGIPLYYYLINLLFT